jgi:hypothetical protein
MMAMVLKKTAYLWASINVAATEWTLNSASYGENLFDLSDTDKEFIKNQYP